MIFDSQRLRRQKSQKYIDASRNCTRQHQKILGGLEMANIEGLGPDVEKIVLEGGGEKSATPYRFQDLPPLAMAEIARRFAYGVDVRGYPPRNWRKLPIDNFINHGLAHVMAYLAGDTTDDHASAFAWNFVCALELIELEKQKPAHKQNIGKIGFCTLCGFTLDDKHQLLCNQCAHVRTRLLYPEV